MSAPATIPRIAALASGTAVASTPNVDHASAVARTGSRVPTAATAESRSRRSASATAPAAPSDERRRRDRDEDRADVDPRGVREREADHGERGEMAGPTQR